MTKVKSFIIFVSVFAFLSAFALVGAKDAKSQESPALSDLVKRIESLEAKGAGGNVSAPKIRGLKIGGMIKHRFEYRDNNLGDESYSRGNATSRDDSEFMLQRIWIDFDADVSKHIRGFVRLQEARTWGTEQGTTGNLGNVDVMEGWVDIRNLDDWSPMLKNFSFKFGRWQQFYGEHRLIGHLNWANQGRGYDGVKLRWDDKKGNWIDAFAYLIEEAETGAASGAVPGKIPNPSGTSDRDELFWGFYSQFNVPGVEGMQIQPYLIVRNRSTDAIDVASTNATSTSTTNPLYVAGENRWTFGGRVTGKNIEWLPGVDFRAEQAWQRGRLEPQNPAASSNIQAFAGAWGAGYTFSNVPWTPRIGYDYVYASGDKRPGSGDSKTFSQLYPTGHARLGYIDFHGWQNIRDHQIHLTLKPTKKLLLKADYHHFSAADDRDRWYNVGGGSNGNAAASRSGGFDSDYGQEIDLTLKYQMFKHMGVTVGYSHYFIDDAIENVRNNVQDGDTDWLYIQTIMKF
ncbi:MAG: alginate export family protein [Planctomycetota bacterium]